VVSPCVTSPIAQSVVECKKIGKCDERSESLLSAVLWAPCGVALSDGLLE